MTEQREYKNGLRLVHYPSGGRVAYCCILIKVGTRDEEMGEEGFSHFTEHAIFKGTAKRRTFQILSRLDEVGGELNAYTTKEYTCLHATFLTEHYERVLELFHDILFNSTFPEKEMEREKEVILDELVGYEDNPVDAIFDEFEELVFAGHALGKNILGTKKSIQKATASALKEFVQKHYHPERMVISSAGNIAMYKLEAIVQKYFASFTSGAIQLNRTEPPIITNPTVIKKRSVNQIHNIIGWRAYPFNHPYSHVLELLSSYLGGNALNARLYMQIREKKGLAYNIESSLSTFSDVSLFLIYFASEFKNKEQIHELISKELAKLRNNAMSSSQLERIKKQMEGQMTISLDFPESLMNHNGKELLYSNTIESVDGILSKLRNLQANDILEVANQVFNVDDMASLAYIPKKSEQK
jgi:predicted Zn-dependent peptidase